MSLIDWHVSVAARESRFPSLSHIYIFSIFSTIGRRLITIEIGSRVATTPPPPPSSPPPLYLDSRDSFAAPFGLRCAHIKVHCHTYSLITMVWVNELQTARNAHLVCWRALSYFPLNSVSAAQRTNTDGTHFFTLKSDEPFCDSVSRFMTIKYNLL